MSLPTGPEHDHWADATGSYVLGAMPESEALAFSAHLEVCAACRAEVDELEPAAHALPASVAPVAAPARIADRVMAEVRREAQLLAAAGESADRVPDESRAPARATRRWLGWAAPALVAGALLVGLVAGLAIAGLGGGSSTRTIAATTSGAAAGAQARLTMDDARAILTVSHLPQPRRGQVYQVWLKPKGGAVEPTQMLFAPRANGRASVAVPASARHMEAVMVTAEPAGGSDQPTSPPILTARVS